MELKDAHERILKRVDKLNDENDDMRRQLQQAQREIRASQRDELHEQMVESHSRLTSENGKLKRQLQQLRASQMMEGHEEDGAGVGADNSNKPVRLLHHSSGRRLVGNAAP